MPVQEKPVLAREASGCLRPSEASRRAQHDRKAVGRARGKCVRVKQARVPGAIEG